MTGCQAQLACVCVAAWRLAVAQHQQAAPVGNCWYCRRCEMKPERDLELERLWFLWNQLNSRQKKRVLWQFRLAVLRSWFLKTLRLIGVKTP